MTKMQKLEIVIKEWEQKAASLSEEARFARNHNFTIEAQIIYDKKQLIEDMCRSIRLKVIEELITV